MQIEISPESERAVQHAIRTGTVKSAAEFVDRLIRRYAEAKQDQTELENQLLAALDSGFETFDSLDEFRKSMMDEFEERLADERS